MAADGAIAASESSTPPLAFGAVCAGVYRSGFPTRHNLRFLERLNLQTMISLEPTPYQPVVRAWIERCGITIVECTLQPNQEPFVVMDLPTVQRALRLMRSSAHHPLLVHGLRGKHRTGCLVGCLRRAQCWSLAATFDEYRCERSCGRRHRHARTLTRRHPLSAHTPFPTNRARHAPRSRFAGASASALDLQYIELFCPSSSSGALVASQRGGASTSETETDEPRPREVLRTAAARGRGRGQTSPAAKQGSRGPTGLMSLC